MSAGVAGAETLRIATFAAPLSRDGPGVLMRDLRKGADPQIDAIVGVVVQTAPDLILLTNFDYDYDALALQAFALILSDRGLSLPYRFAARPNTGWATGLDMDGNGYLGDARDAQGYGRFAGDGGMAVLSRWPIDAGAVTDLSAILWRDVQGAVLPVLNGKPFPSETAQAAQRLSHGAHWIVPINPPDAPPFELMAWSATTPVFDGPEDRNGLRNRDELRLWEIEIAKGRDRPFVVLGNANLDPNDGEGLRDAMAAFLANPAIQDPQPASIGAEMAADPDHRGPAKTDTADWPSDGPGNLRVSYVLPSADWRVVDAGVFWPDPADPAASVLGGRRAGRRSAPFGLGGLKFLDKRAALSPDRWV